MKPAAKPDWRSLVQAPTVKLNLQGGMTLAPDIFISFPIVAAPGSLRSYPKYAEAESKCLPRPVSPSIGFAEQQKVKE
jgi:hypothetical protein